MRRSGTIPKVTPKRRRPPGDGSLYQRKSDGRWVAAYIDRGRKVVVYGASAKEAADKLRLKRNDKTPIPKGRLTCADWFSIWIADAARDGHYAPGTIENYRGTISLHLVPSLGSRRLAKLTADDVRDMLADLDARSLSASVRARCHSVLKSALEEAFRRELVSANVASRVRAPRFQTKRRRAISLADTLSFIRAAIGDENEALYLLLLANGLREAEAFGLKPADLDLAANTLRVERQLSERKGGLFETPPKGGKSATVPLAPFVTEPLRRHLTKRNAQPGIPYLFTSARGFALRRSVFLRKTWHPFLKDHDLPHMVPHQMRHTTGTLLKSLGVPVEVVREILRHASVETTALIYQDEIPSLQRTALARLSKLLSTHANSNGKRAQEEGRGDPGRRGRRSERRYIPGTRSAVMAQKR